MERRWREEQLGRGEGVVRRGCGEGSGEWSRRRRTDRWGEVMRQFEGRALGGEERGGLVVGGRRQSYREEKGIDEVFQPDGGHRRGKRNGAV